MAKPKDKPQGLVFPPLVSVGQYVGTRNDVLLSVFTDRTLIPVSDPTDTQYARLFADAPEMLSIIREINASGMVSQETFERIRRVVADFS